MNLLMMQRYGEKPPIPNIPSDFFLTTRDTPLILATKPTHALNLCRKHPQKYSSKFGDLDKRLYLCSRELHQEWLI